MMTGECACTRIRRGIEGFARTPYPAGLVIVNEPDWQHLNRHEFLKPESRVSMGRFARLADGTLVVVSASVRPGEEIILARMQVHAYATYLMRQGGS